MRSAVSAPSVTIIMPCFNGAKYLRASIGSLLAQEFRDFRLLVIDDGSTDESVSVVEQFAAADGRISLLRNGDNLGLVATRNRGLEEAEGEFIAWLDCDDVATPDRLQKQIAFLGSNPQIGAVGSWVAEIDKDGATNGRRWILNARPAAVASMMLFRCYCAQSAITARSSVITEMRYDAAYPPAEDYEFNARLSQRTQMWNLPKVLCYYRRHSASSSTMQWAAAEAALMRLFAAQLHALGIKPSEQELFVHRCLFDIATRHRAPLDEVHEWLEKLLRANDANGLYQREAFAQVIAAQWLYACWASSQPPLDRLRRFAQAPLVRQTRLSAAEWLRFAGNSVERWLRSGLIPTSAMREVPANLPRPNDRGELPS